MTRILLLSIALLSFTACGKEEAKPPVCTTEPIQPLKIIDKPIDFGPERIAMTKAYIKTHYGKDVDSIEITPRIILLHWTAELDFDRSFKRLQPERLLSDRKDIVKASALNVSSQFMVARDGTIYRLMPENWMARHVIGLNYSSIGIENVGGKDNKIDDLTPAQRQANIDLVMYLKGKYPTIEYLVGHHEYRQMESTPLWLEKDKGYRTVKSDPGEKFMSEIREAVKCLKLKAPPEGT
jgi:beta-N-acetylhexosaminidase